MGTVRPRAGEAVSAVTEIARTRPRLAGAVAGLFGLALVAFIWIAAEPSDPDPSGPADPDKGGENPQTTFTPIAIITHLY